ncbi:hypothetical protein J6590_047961 [Homalodisca vitripennis]|nr:hypothetical protein J6590_047961 [Homalodisca vitripennis]
MVWMVSLMTWETAKANYQLQVSNVGHDVPISRSCGAHEVWRNEVASEVSGRHAREPEVKRFLNQTEYDDRSVLRRQSDSHDNGNMIGADPVTSKQIISSADLSNCTISVRCSQTQFHDGTRTSDRSQIDGVRRNRSQRISAIQTTLTHVILTQA